MVGSIEGILGLRPDIDGLRLSPAVPSDWKSFTIEKTFRGCILNIKINNPDGKESGCKKLTVNGTAMEGNYIPASVLKAENEIALDM
jgi:cellobiose phosphorylase